VHYIPVKPDLSDFSQHFKWAYENPEKTAEMVACAARAMLDITFHEQVKWGSIVLESVLNQYVGPLVGDLDQVPVLEVDITY